MKNDKIKNLYVAAISLSLVLGVGCKKSSAPTPIPQEAVATTEIVVRKDASLDAIIAPDAKLKRVATGTKFAEGPVWFDGKLWLSDVVGNKLYTLSPDGQLQVMFENSGGLTTVPEKSFQGSNGMAIDGSGDLLICQHGIRRIARMDSKHVLTTFLDKFEGKRLNSPNDLVFAPDGSLWFTDPPYGLLGQDKDPAKELKFNGVYRYQKGKLKAVVKDLTRPNGIGLSPDGKTLYVANSGPKMFVNRYAVQPNGEVANATQLISYDNEPDTEVPDGLKVDTHGNIWTTGPGGIRIISPAGKVLGQIKLPEVAANLAWGEDGKAVYITASTSIYRLPLIGTR